MLDINVLFPFNIPIFIPRWLSEAFVYALSRMRIIAPREASQDEQNGKIKSWVRLNFPMNFLTAPLIADLFLLAISAIGRQEVHDGTIGANHISPIDIMAFFITLAYIAISIDASGLIRYLAFKVLQWGGKVGPRLFFYLYTFFFVLGSFIGNDPIILSGTAFLAYMTRVSSNIIHPRAWIHTQFAIANIASAILVSSNPTNLVLAGAFGIKFIHYTANMVVPVVITAVALFPFLLYIVFADESLIPTSIKMHELPEEMRAKKPVNPNIPNARGTAEEQENSSGNDEQSKRLSLEEIMNPFLDKGGAAFGGAIMAATLVTVLVLNAVSTSNGQYPVYWVTLPAAFIMLCWDLAFGWYNRHETREIARKGRKEIEDARAERAMREEEQNRLDLEANDRESFQSQCQTSDVDGSMRIRNTEDDITSTVHGKGKDSVKIDMPSTDKKALAIEQMHIDQHSENLAVGGQMQWELLSHAPDTRKEGVLRTYLDTGVDNEKVQLDIERPSSSSGELPPPRMPKTLISILGDAYRWCQETFPTVTAVLAHLPLALIPFAFTMFVLVQALVTKGWVQVIAHGWDHWVTKTGTVGGIGGMGFLSVILCNVSPRQSRYVIIPG
jgi:Na+/H+ antiporter NhaD/arsenite permease-like protein